MSLLKMISLGAALTVISLVTACGNSQQTSNTATTNGSPGAANTNSAANTTTLPSSPPTATMKAWCEATKKKDAEGWKKAFSQYDQHEIEESAKRDNQSVNAYIKAAYFDNPIISGMGPCDPFIPSNEKITGDKATLDVLNGAGRLMTYTFVIENGEWKISTKDTPEMSQEEMDRQDQQLFDDSEAIRKKKGID